MDEWMKFGLGIAVLFLGIPLGHILAKYTSEELKSGRKWFEGLIIISLLGGIVGFFLGNNGIMFSFFFIAVVTSQSLIEENISEKKSKKRIKR